MARREYTDVLLNGGWLADPGDSVRVVAVHHRQCPSRHRGGCRCRPRLTLVAVGGGEPETGLERHHSLAS